MIVGHFPCEAYLEFSLLHQARGGISYLEGYGCPSLPAYPVLLPVPPTQFADIDYKPYPIQLAPWDPTQLPKGFV